MSTTPNTRWGRLCSTEQIAQLQPLSEKFGSPVVHQVCNPRYVPGVFQVLVLEDGIWIHASLLRRWRTREVLLFMADCDVPSDFRRANPRVA